MRMTAPKTIMFLLSIVLAVLALLSLISRSPSSACTASPS